MAVNDNHSEYNKHKKQWSKLRDCAAGEEQVHEKKTEYLPRLSDQSDTEYKAYLLRSSFYAATARTIDGLSGMIFRKPPSVKLPTILETYSKDITLSGLDLQGFAEEIVDDVVTVGRSGILVDHPQMGEEVETVAQAEQFNMRPFLKHYKAEAIINWKIDGIQNARVITQVRLMETVEEPGEAEFEHEDVEQIRVLDLSDGLYRQRVFRKDKNDEWVQHGPEVFPQMNGAPLTFIPFVFIGVKNTSASVEKPPLIDMANTNLSHYRTTADLEHGAHFTGLPTLFIKGVQQTEEDDTAEYRIGSASAWVFPNPEAEAKYLEFTGTGLEALEKRALKKEEYMAFLGARMLATQKKGVEAVETTKINNMGESSVLASLAQSVSEGLKQALTIMAEWAGSPDAEITYELNKDFIPVIMSSQDLLALMQTWQAGGMAFEDFVWNMKRGEVIKEDRTADDIRAEVELENPFTEDDLDLDDE